MTGVARRRLGRPPQVTREAIAAAVLDVGFHDLTFTAVADRLGIGQATLFRHVPNRDDLVRLGLDLAVRRYPWPSLDGTWREVLERYALAAWRAWETHPGAVVEATRGVLPPSVVALSDEVGAVLLRAGFRPDAAVRAFDLVFDLAADSRRGVELLALPAGRGTADQRGLLDRMWAGGAAAVGPGTATDDERRAVRAAMSAAIRADPVEWFLGKLRVVLAGVEAELAPRPDAGRDRS
ncbi:TetR family transcriptional regulator [Actinosynnema sp. NPDC050436]|uniref:TetR/AcrR family transcriptional regulator n=1 Tax=Actinosynnema sp. NPDC050436 TaxID=3155659 RepID=UPI0033E8279E